MEKPREPQLTRNISVMRGSALAVAMVIGSGLLSLPGLAIDVGGIHGALAGWVITTLAIIPVVYLFMRLGIRFPSADGLRGYARHAFGDWTDHSITLILVGTFFFGFPVVCLIGGEYAEKLLGLSKGAAPWLGIGMMTLLTLMNLTGRRISGAVNTCAVLGLFCVLAFTVVSHGEYLAAGASAFTDLATGRATVDYWSVWKVGSLLFWAYCGWESLSFGLGEFENPARTIPRVYLYSYLAISLLYLGLGFTSVGAKLHGLEMSGNTGLAALFQDSRLGPVFIALMLLALVANANAWIFGASRMIYSAGAAGILPRSLGHLSPGGVPKWSLSAIWFVCVGVILLTQHLEIPVSSLIVLANQSFIALYAISILAFLKLETGRKKWIVGVLSTGLLPISVSGWIIYPIVLGTLGYLSSLEARKSRLTAEIARFEDEFHEHLLQLETGIPRPPRRRHVGQLKHRLRKRGGRARIRSTNRSAS